MTVHVRPERVEDIVYEILRFGIGGGRLVEINDLIVVQQIRRLDAVDRGDGKGSVISAGRADRARIGVGGQAVAAVLFGVEGSVIVVGRGGDQRDACRLDAVVNFVDILFVDLAGETAGGAERHIDDVDAELDAVVERRQNG